LEWLHKKNLLGSGMFHARFVVRPLFTLFLIGLYLAVFVRIFIPWSGCLGVCHTYGSMHARKADLLGSIVCTSFPCTSMVASLPFSPKPEMAGPT
jgi:hypothetical protein